MTDVFFQGYGQWFIVTPSPSDLNPLPIKSNSSVGAAFHSGETVINIINTKQFVHGVFSLYEEDDEIYRHTKSLDNVVSLKPSSHSDDNFLKWSVRRGRCETYDRCLEATFMIDLSKPMKLSIADPQAEPVADAGATHPTRKKLIPLQRETNEALLLLYEIFTHYSVEYLDQLSGHRAWGKIISKEFSSNLISSIAESNKNIILSGGEKLSKTDFSEKYRRRFE